MVDFDKFEQNVKNKYGNQEFPFDEANWEKAAKLIDASRKGKNRGGIFLLSAIMILCTSGLVYYFGFSDNSTALKGKGLAVNQVVNEKQNLNSDNSTQTSTENNSVNGNEETSTASNVTSNNEVKDNSVATNDNTNNSASVKNNSQNNTSSTNVNTENSTSAKTSNANNTSSANETKTEKTTSASSNTNSETKTSSNTVNKSKNTPQAKSVNKNTTPPVLGSENNVTTNTNKNIPETPAVSITGNTEKLGNTNSENNKETGIVKSNDPVVIDTITAKPHGTVKVTKSGVDSLPKMSKGRADSIAAMLPKGDGVSYATNVKVNHNAKNILFAEVGTTYLLGWHGSGKNEAGGFNVLAGLNFQHYFTGNVAAQIGVLYNTIDNLSNTSHTISTVKYDLGMEADVTSIRYQKLHYVVAPIKLTYVVKDNNIFTVGCNVAYLLNSDSKKEKYKTFSNDPNATKNNLTSTKESGYVQGFNPYDIQITAGYRRKIYKGLSANAEFFYGLTDTKNNSFFKSDNFDRNVGFKVSLCYDLFKK